ncbi:hypothetical protein BC829DRAFT_445017 [Chytridium lagenaria]|nr:hypothetical protein BC829DRAFT_445017 [Chytridium lagenaria]
MTVYALPDHVAAVVAVVAAAVDAAADGAVLNAVSAKMNVSESSAMTALAACTASWRPRLEGVPLEAVAAITEYDQKFHGFEVVGVVYILSHNTTFGVMSGTNEHVQSPLAAKPSISPSSPGNT